MEQDEETGLAYHSARYYANWLGRWTASDPIGLEGGGNRFGYSNNNPTLFTDPDGTDPRGPDDQGPSVVRSDVSGAEPGDTSGSKYIPDLSTYEADVAIFGTLKEAREAVREAIYIEAEASKLLGLPAHAFEWHSAIFSEAVDGELRYGFTKPILGSPESASIRIRSNPAFKQRTDRQDTSTELIELVHTHPRGAAARLKDLAVDRFSRINYQAGDTGEIKGDIAQVLWTGIPLALITPSGEYLVASSTREHPVARVLPGDHGGERSGSGPAWIRRRFKEGAFDSTNTVITQELPGTGSAAEWRPEQSKLERTVWIRMNEMAKEEGLSEREQKRADRRFDRQTEKGRYK